MNNNKRISFELYVDGVCMGRFYGWKNIREAVARYEAKGKTVSMGR